LAFALLKSLLFGVTLCFSYLSRRRCQVRRRVQAVLGGNLYRQTSLDVKTILHGTPDTAIDTIITHNSTGYAFFTYLANIVHVSSEPPNKGWTVKY